MRRPTTLHLCALAAILALGAALRFYDLPSRGYVYWDEGKFALEGIRFQTALHALTGAHVSPNAGKSVGTAKPTHALLIGLADTVVGVHDYAALLLDAAASLIGVALTYLIARRLFDPAIALLSALFLAVSEYDVIYARSALSESDANVFFLAGVLAWVSGRGPGARLLAGVLLGLSFTTNYRLIVYCATLVAFDLLRQWREPGRGKSLRRALLWAGGLAVAPLAWQLADLVERARGIVLFRSELTGRPAWYVRQALFQLHEGRQSALHFGPLPYLHWYLLREGWPMAVLIVAGALMLILWPPGRGWESRVPVALLVVPYLLYVFAPFAVPRNLDATVPFASMLAAVALCRTARRLLPPGARHASLLLAALALAALGTAMSWRLTAERSGFAQAAGYVAQHARGRALVSNEIMVFYLRGSGPHCTAPRIPRYTSELASALALGYHYAVLDQFNRQASRFVRHHMPLVARYSLTGRLSVGENLITSEATGANRNDPNDAVSVYRLVPSLLPPASSARLSCNRNRV